MAVRTLVWMVLVTAIAGGLPEDALAADPGSAHVRGLDSVSNMLVEDGISRSATFKGLVEALNTHEVIVLVTTRSLQDVDGRTVLVGASQGWRFLRVTINTPRTRDLLLACLAHELQHAVEIARAPSVVSASTLQGFYQRNGQQLEHGWCTTAAQGVTIAVVSELYRRHWR